MSVSWKTFVHPHYFINLLLAACFYVLKVTPVICEKLFPHAEKVCFIEWREYEILAFAAIVIIFKTKRVPSWLGYVNVVCFIAKVTNCVLLGRQDLKLAIVFCLLCLVHVLIFPEPACGGSEKVVALCSGALEEELKQCPKNKVWFVLFYNPWSPLSQQFLPIFSFLASRYSLPNFVFGKIDAVKNEDTAKEFKIDAGLSSKQLPSVILFRGGAEVKRRPHVDAKSRVQRYVFYESNVAADFDLANIHRECKSSLIGKEGKMGSSTEIEYDAPFEGYVKNKTELQKKSNRIMMDRFANVGNGDSILTKKHESDYEGEPEESEDWVPEKLDTKTGHIKAE